MSATPYSGRDTRKNIVAFLIGKVPTALLTAAILGVTARALPVAEFGRYVVVMASIELVLGLSTLGMDWVLLRYVPACRLGGGRRQLIQIIAGVAVCRSLTLAILAGAMFWLGPRLGQLGLALPPDLLGLFCVLLVVEGVMRVFRDNALEALAQQSQLQLSTLAKGCTLLLALLYLGRAGDVSAAALLAVEIGAALLSMLLACGFVVRVVASLAQGVSALPAPDLRQMARVALHNYASGVVEYLYSPSFLVLLLAKAQPAAAIAGLGFVLRLVDIIRNYLPGMVVFGVVRARMIGAYAGNHDFAELRAWAQFVYKVSALTLFPVLGIAVLYGDQVLSLASGGRYAEYHALFVALCCWLLLRLHRLILGVVCNAIDLMRLWARASLLSLLLLPVVFALGYQPLGVWFLVVALFGNELMINALAVLGMRRAGFAWNPPGRWVLRAVLATALASAAAWLVPGGGRFTLGVGVALLCAAYSGAVLVLGVFDRPDRQLINRTVGRTLFRLD